MNQRGERHTTTPEMLLGAYIATASVDNQPLFMRQNPNSRHNPIAPPVYCRQAMLICFNRLTDKGWPTCVFSSPAVPVSLALP
jgi:hypothetical protein